MLFFFEKTPHGLHAGDVLLNHPNMSVGKSVSIDVNLRKSSGDIVLATLWMPVGDCIVLFSDSLKCVFPYVPIYVAFVFDPAAWPLCHDSGTKSR